MVILLLYTCGVFAGGILCLRNALSDIYLKFYPFLTGVILIAIGSVLVWLFIRTKRFWVYSDRLEVKDVFGNTKQIVAYNAIEYWTEEEVKTRYETYNLLSVYTQDGKYALPANGFSDYDKVKQIITRGKPENEAQESLNKARKQRIIGITFIGFSLLFLGFSYLAAQSKAIIKKEELTTIAGTLYRRPKIIEYSKSTARDLDIWVNEFPDYTFKMSNDDFWTSYGYQFVKEVAVGDSVQIDILTTAAKKKINHEIPLGFFDKTIDYRYINVYGLRHNGQSYLSLEDLNRGRARPVNPKPLYMAFGCFLFLFSLGAWYLWKANQNPVIT